MSEVSSYPDGAPSWVDLGTTDVEAARGFYSGLFGWDYEIGPAETGHYTICRLRGRTVAGMYRLSEEMTAQGVPPNWMTYLSSADADATAIEAAAGTVLTGPLDVMDQGRMLVARDPSGAVFGVWQPRSHRGAQLVDEPGSRAWSELVTRDHAAARRFYPSIFAYQTEDMDIGAAEPYVLFKVAGTMVAGMMAAPPGLPAEAPSSWMTYFAVADTDATVGRVQSSGGGLLFGPQDSEYGRFAVVSDPQGAVLSVIRPPQPAGG